MQYIFIKSFQYFYVNVCVCVYKIFFNFFKNINFILLIFSKLLLMLLLIHICLLVTFLLFHSKIPIFIPSLCTFIIVIFKTLN
jgi:hypothetical protein